MKKVDKISVTERKNLEDIKKNHVKYRERERASGIMLSYRGYSPKEIAEIFEIYDRMVYKWIDNFNENGVLGLLTQKGQGRKPILKKEHEELVKAHVKEHPFQLSTVCAKLLNDGIEISKQSLKRFLRKLGYSYKRARASITKQDKEIIKEAKKEIEHFKDEVNKDDAMNLYYFDESSFLLSPNIPYGWSPKNETIMLEATRSTSLKVLGFLGLDNQLKAYTTTDTINSDVVIAIFDDFIEQLSKNNKKTIVILDNAPTHTSKAFQDKIEEWEKKGLILYFLPTYSPELNRIEILWRFMKYHWIEIKDYASTQALENYIDKVLSTYGVENGFEINFE